MERSQQSNNHLNLLQLTDWSTSPYTLTCSTLMEVKRELQEGSAGKDSPFFNHNVLSLKRVNSARIDFYHLISSSVLQQQQFCQPLPHLCWKTSTLYLFCAIKQPQFGWMKYGCKANKFSSSSNKAAAVMFSQVLLHLLIFFPTTNVCFQLWLGVSRWVNALMFNITHICFYLVSTI